MLNSEKSNKKLNINYKIRAQGDRCINVDFGEAIDPEIGRMCLSAAAMLRRAQLPGVFEIVPSYISVALHYAPTFQPTAGYSAFETLAMMVENLLSAGLTELAQESRTIQIPICYGGVHGPDLLDIAERIKLSPEEVIEHHTKSIAMVYMLGFAPGCPYVALLDPVFAIPRRDMPLTSVPAGSVVVANRQNLIYPSALPCGWHILGATPLKMFDLDRTPPALLAPGDYLEFTSICMEEYEHIKNSEAVLGVNP